MSTPVLLVSDVEALTGRCARTLRSDVREGRLPRPRSLGQTAFWFWSDLEPALRALPHAEKWPGPDDSVSPTTEAEAA